MTDLKSLLSAVQSGDATTSKTAAGTLMNDLKSQAETFQSQLASMAQPPFFDGAGGGLANVRSAYFQWS